MKLIRHGYLVFSLDICVHKTSTETGLMATSTGAKARDCVWYGEMVRRLSIDESGLAAPVLSV